MKAVGEILTQLFFGEKTGNCEVRLAALAVGAEKIRRLGPWVPEIATSCPKTLKRCSGIGGFISALGP